MVCSVLKKQEAAMTKTSPTSIIVALTIFTVITSSLALAQRPSRGGGAITPPPQPIPVPVISPR